MVADWMKDNSMSCTYVPFEAEWQCTKLEQMNLVDVVMSTDADCIILSPKKVCFDVDFHEYTL